MSVFSFGYCEKVCIDDDHPVGRYGNGFKSGSMRLGSDTIVFTINASSMSIGLLSQTFLKDIGSDTVLVPIVSYDRVTSKLLHVSRFALCSYLL